MTKELVTVLDNEYLSLEKKMQLNLVHMVKMTIKICTQKKERQSRFNDKFNFNLLY